MDNTIDVDVAVIALQLRKFRLKRKLSQQAIGDVIEVTNQQFSKYETGSNRISAAHLRKIANTYSVPVELFFNDVEF